jgi:hypothetical protein
MMRVAVFADLHGNPYACRAVLQAIKDEGPPDAIVAAGDLCLGGSDPSACIDMLQDAGVVAVYGNTETYLLAPNQEPPDETHLKHWHWIQPGVYWTLEQLRPEQLAWLSSLPFELRYPLVESAPENDLLVVHANPRDVELMIYPDEAEQKRLWDEVRQPDNDPDLSAVLKDVSASVLAFGHFHYTFQRPWRHLSLVDVGPCSMPGYDHDRRARYTLFSRESAAGQHQPRWRIDQRWVRYDAEMEIDALKASSMPGAEKYLRNFD